jgi:hypothetical protein
METTIITRWARRAARASSALALSLMASAAFAQAPAQSSGQVQAQSLRALDLWSAAGRDTGLPDTLWRHASPDLVRAVLTVLPDHALSPAMAALARRVLETGANAPEGAGSDLTLAALRVRALVALGDLSAAETILARTASIEASEPMSREKAEIALLAGRDGEACDTDRALQQGRDGAWWLKLRAYCSLVGKQPAAAQVTLDLWRQGGGRAPAFERLMNAAINGTPAGKPALDEPLVFALSRRLGLELAAAVPTTPMPETVALARDPNTPQATRLEALARALRLDAVPVQAVRDAYLAAAGASAPPPPGAAPGWTATPTPPPSLQTAAADPSATGEAGLYAVAAQSHDLSEREQAISALLGRSKTNIDFLALSHLVAPAIAELVRAQPALRDPVLFATASAMAADAKTAAAIRANIQQGQSPSSAPLDLALLDALISVQTGKGAETALDRLIERGGAGDPNDRARAQAASLLLADLDVDMSPDALTQLASFELAPARASPARLAALDAAASDHRMGETALVALEIAEQAAQGLTIADRAAIAAALRRSGLHHDAAETVAQGLLAEMK